MNDLLPFQAAPFPQCAANALHTTADSLLSDNDQWNEFQAIWLKYPLAEATEHMIAYLVEHGVEFTCPLCGNTGIRQRIEMINDVFEGVRDEPCCCPYGNAESVDLDDRYCELPI